MRRGGPGGADRARAVHEPLLLPLPGLPARAPQRPVLTGRGGAPAPATPAQKVPARRVPTQAASAAVEPVSGCGASWAPSGCVR
ncbi:hypothetical protein ABL57_16710 [Kocuria sp. SM24M-10]|nr:hypothetical protein ABL57_16710 [Kocuria sp. SM24M-10]